MTAATIGARVKARIDAQGLSLKAAARLSEERGTPVAFSTIQKLVSSDDESPQLLALRNLAATLGMGLSELLGEDDAAVSIPTADIAASPLNPRKSFDPAAIAEMAESLRQHGQLQPIIVRPGRLADSLGRYEIVIGERRWRAAVEAKIATMRAIVRDVSDAELLALAITENLQRVDMSALDTADAFLAAKQAGHKPKAIAVMASRGVRVVQEYISVAEHLCKRGRDLVAQGDLSISQAIALAGERDPAQQAADAAWADINKASEDAIRARITRRKEAADAPLFGDDAPPAKGAKAKEWPQPSGLVGDYDKAASDQWSFAEHPLDACLMTLQIEPDVWIATYRFDLRSRIRGLISPPLRAGRTWPSQAAATRWTAVDVVNDALASMRHSNAEERAVLGRAVTHFIGATTTRLQALGMPAHDARAATNTLHDRVARLLAGDPTPRDANAPAPAMERVEAEADDGEDIDAVLDEPLPATPWHEGLTFVYYLAGRMGQRPVVRRSLTEMMHFHCARAGFVSSQLRGIEDMDGWQHDEDGALYILLPGGDGPVLYIADDGR